MMPSDVTADAIVHHPDPKMVEEANVTAFMRAHHIADEDELIERAKTDLDWFWGEVIDTLDIEFYTPFDAVRDDNRGPAFTRWYPGGRINVAHNVLDRYADATDRPAIVWEAEDGSVSEIGFPELADRASQVANALASLGVGAGDRVGLYMPMIPPIVPILYGCFKRGAIVVPIFSGFGVDAVVSRIRDSTCSILFTADGFYRRGEERSLKPTADAAIERARCVDHTIVYERTGNENGWNPDRDLRWDEAVLTAPYDAPTREMASNDPSMILYSSGTTGRPKGIVQTHAGILLQPAKEIFFNFDHRPTDRFFWISDIGWMMGPWALIGNHAFGGTVLLYEGAPDYPDPDRFWRLIERHEITTFGVSPTAIRTLREYGTDWVTARDLSTLRLLGSTGEPWDADSWHWYYEVVGERRCPIINISGGTEICGCFLMPLPTQPLKPGTLGGPGLGMAVDIVNEAGESIVDTGDRGYLVARDSCPSMTKSLWEGDDRYVAEYWSTWENLWDHGDWARVDSDGHWYLLGRADDILNVAGRRVGPAEIEAALIEDPAVSHAAAVGVPDEQTGTAVVAYVALESNVPEDEDLAAKLREHVGSAVGKPFRPKDVNVVEELPLTQSGKIVRRVVRAAHLGEEAGDMSTIANPAAVSAIRDSGE